MWDARFCADFFSIFFAFLEGEEIKNGTIKNCNNRKDGIEHTNDGRKSKKIQPVIEGSEFIFRNKHAKATAQLAIRNVVTGSSFFDFTNFHDKKPETNQTIVKGRIPANKISDMTPEI